MVIRSKSRDLFPASADGWTPLVLTCSSLTGEGIAEVWQMVRDHRKLVENNGFLSDRRSRQSLEWMRELVMLGLEGSFREDRAVTSRLPLLEEEVRRGHVTPFAASRELLQIFHS